MNRVLKIAVDKPTNKGEKEAIGTLIKSFDRLLNQYEIDPVIWEADEDGDRFVFEAYIPGDCLPEFDECADFINECFAQFRERFPQKESP